MANETLSSSLTEIVNSEFISPQILDYAIDNTVIAPLCRVERLMGKATATAAFPRWIKDTGADLTEGSDLSNNELETSENTAVTAAMVGILREITDFAQDTTILGRAGLLQMVLEDGAKLCTEMLEDDLAAVFASASTSVGTSGADMTIANFVEALCQLDTNKARGPKWCVLDDQQSSDFLKAIAASTATTLTNEGGSMLNQFTQSRSFLGIPVYVTNLTDTANMAADVVGCMGVDGVAAPANAPIGIALLWEPRVKMASDPATVSDVLSITQAHGVGEISDFNYVKIVTDA
jgi:hypothetical protein